MQDSLSLRNLFIHFPQLGSKLILEAYSRYDRYCITAYEMCSSGRRLMNPWIMRPAA